jgi:predicted DCC family thiol-disulfide oxidoreductase YuxK
MQKRATLPLLIYDGDCRFCRFWIERWKKLTRERVEYAPYQTVAGHFPEIPIENFEKSVQLVLPTSEVFSGAQAVFRALSFAPGKGWMHWMYQKIPGFASISEGLYRLVANRRPFFSKLTWLFFGNHVEPPSHFIVRGLFLKALGLIYLIAFFSFGIQVLGLIGSDGILPIKNFLEAVESRVADRGYWLIPTLFWIDSSDLVLQLACVFGAMLSIHLILGFFQRIALIVLYLLYLSLFYAGQTFMSFQWDILLLEVGFLSIFLGSSTNEKHSTRPSRTVIWLFRWLLFRFILLSGAVKLLSGDPTWRNLTALNFHYETQPLPTLLSWYMHQLPEWFQKCSVGMMFFIELVIPFLIFAPRRIRFFAAASIVGLQILIFLTGNYNFFNLLTVALCLFLLDDAFLARFIPEKFKIKTVEGFIKSRVIVLKKILVGAVSIVILFVSGFQLLETFFRVSPRFVIPIETWISRLRIVNTYGLFAVMTTSRPEIVVEGSYDGKSWIEYEFKYKPGDLKRPPVWAAPHQPRLDWQMWFAALGNYKRNPWFVNFAVRLLQGSPEVLKLLEKNPFPTKPPQFIRAVLYNYYFTDQATKKLQGTWWKRDEAGDYLPAISLQED